MVHQIGNTLRHVSWKDRKELAGDLKTVYGAATVEEARAALDASGDRWGGKYPHALKSWRANWVRLTACYRYPVEIRKIMYATNLIESVNSRFRKVTGARRVFPADDSVLKALFMAALDLEKKRTMPVRDWATIYAQLMILFEDRLQ